MFLMAEPGLAQLGAALLIFIPTIGLTFSIQAIYAERKGLDRTIRMILAALSLFTLCHPDMEIAAIGAVPVCVMVGFWLVRRRLTASARKSESLA